MQQPPMPTTVESAGNPPLAINAPVRRLIAIVAALRTPKTGCAWDLDQTHASIAPYAVEEAYEVIDAIERGDMDDLRDELGDLLLQVVFHARIAEESGAFSFDDVAVSVGQKMVRRHPQIFDAVEKRPALSGVDKIWEAMRAKREAKAGKVEKGLLGADSEAAQGAQSRTEGVLPGSSSSWDAIKAEERRAKNTGGTPDQSVLADTPKALPGMIRAVKLQKKASAVGFDWGDAKLVLAKLREEIDEIEAELDGGTPDAITSEVGDLLFAVANLARHAGIDPETAVRGANAKFERRFAYIEAALAAKGSSPAASTLDEMDALWNEAKTSGR